MGTQDDGSRRWDDGWAKHALGVVSIELFMFSKTPKRPSIKFEELEAGQFMLDASFSRGDGGDGLKERG